MKSAAAGAPKLGAFLGVYLPTTLTILGVIMYLRSGWLVGHLGLARAILVIVAANLITLVTTLSFSSIATNITVGTGGAYYIASRSLGPEIGGAVGVPLFFSQAFSVTLYAFGFAEALRLVWPAVPIQPAALVMVVVVGALSLIGADFALKTQVPILILVAASLLALTIGAVTASGGHRISMTVGSGELGFWAGFAVFFPAVTGVMAGLGMSGDLREPGRAIPVGSILAVLTGFVVYLTIPFLLSIAATPEQLRGDSLIWTRVALFGPWLIVPGLLGAIFSSAVGSMLGAPRTLQALAMDRIAPRVFGRSGSGWRALAPGYALSLAIALGAVAIGDLNRMAPFITMFFLTVYAVINVAAAIETLSGDPSWRPRLKVHWSINLLGGAACAGAMLLVNPLACLFATAAVAAIWVLLARRERRSRWGDARRGSYESLIRWALIRLASQPVSARSWRPHILMFASDPVGSMDAIRFADWFSQGRGIVTVCHLQVGVSDDPPDVRAREAEMRRVFEREGLVVFPEFEEVGELVAGMVDIAQANGIAGLASNTVMVGWPDERSRLADFLKAMKRLERYSVSFIISRIRPRRHLFPMASEPRTIYIWWGGLQRNSDLMLLLAYLLTRNHDWHHARVRVLSLASNDLMRQRTEHHLAELLSEIRIDVETEVLVHDEDSGETVGDIIRSRNSEADVVFLGLAKADDGEELDYAERLADLAGDAQVVFFVKNSSLFSGELLAPGDDEQAVVPVDEL